MSSPTSFVGTDDGEAIVGTDGRDTVVALGGDDTITGGLDNDALIGGVGVDTARFDDVDVGVHADLAGNDTTREVGFEMSVRGAPLASLTTDQTVDELVAEAANDGLYFNIHTTDFPGGEIRGQLIVSSDIVAGDARTIVLTASLDAAQEPGPTSDSEATGTATVIITVTPEATTYSAELAVTGISTADLLPVAGVSSIHLHNAPAGANGPVITDIIQDAGGDVQGVALTALADTGDGDVFREQIERDIVLEVENLVGSNDDDELAGDAGANVLEGLDGDDRLDGRAGNDTLLGGAGNDTLRGGGGTDVIDGGAGIDTNDFSTINAGAANPQVAGVVATLNADGSGVASYIAGGVPGNPVVVEEFHGIENLTGSGNADTLIAVGDADNVLAGGGGNDVLAGGDGDDVLAGGGGLDTLDGGAGNDTNSFVGIGAEVVASLASGNASYMPAPGVTVFERFSNFENLDGSANDDQLFGDGQANVLAGNDGNDLLVGGGGDDTLLGGAGDDLLRGGGGNDVTDGGEGVDTVDFSDIGTSVAASLEDGVASYEAPSGAEIVDEVLNVENITGSAFDDALEGDAGDNLIAGGAGADTLVGGAGDDVLRGDAVGDGVAVVVSVTNELGEGGTFLTPVWFGFHDGSAFDAFDIGAPATLGLELLAEDGSIEGIAAEFNEIVGDGGLDATVVGGAGAPGPIDPGETATFTIDVDPDEVGEGFFTWATMVIPSNDAFLAVPDDALADPIFDENGDFQGLVIERTGADVLDAGTEVNTEEDAAFLNQTAPDTGVDENGTVQPSPGFNGSAGFPDGEPVNILSGDAVTAAGSIIDPAEADFTLDDDLLVTITVEELAGSNDRLEGGAGNDTLEGGGGQDTFVLALGGGSDTVLDFAAGDEDGDVLDVAGLDIVDFQAALNLAQQVGDDVVFDFGDGDAVTLLDVELTDLAASNFNFASADDGALI